MSILSFLLLSSIASLAQVSAGFSPIFVKDIGYQCPSSPALMHAGCQVMIAFENSCDSVTAEIKARINGEGGWEDPHNNGTYAIIKESSSLLEVSRLTGDGKYTDLINYSFEKQGDSACSVAACSESQVYSIGDAGTNFCNIPDLYCQESGCNPINSLKYTESVGKCTQG